MTEKRHYSVHPLQEWTEIGGQRYVTDGKKQSSDFGPVFPVVMVVMVLLRVLICNVQTVGRQIAK